MSPVSPDTNNEVSAEFTTLLARARNNVLRETARDYCTAETGNCSRASKQLDGPVNTSNLLLTAFSSETVLKEISIFFRIVFRFYRQIVYQRTARMDVPSTYFFEIVCKLLRPCPRARSRYRSSGIWS